MPQSKEFAIRLEDRPGVLGKLCRALADRSINIVAFSACPIQGQSSLRLVVDNPTACKSVLDTQKLNYTEAEVAQVVLPNRVGELARAASQLGEANVNINYCYSGMQPVSNAPLLCFGVDDVAKATSLLDKMIGSKAA